MAERRSRYAMQGVKFEMYGPTSVFGCGRTAMANGGPQNGGLARIYASVGAGHRSGGGGGMSAVGASGRHR